MATASFRLTVDGDREAGVLQALSTALLSARECPGCLSCRIERDPAAGTGLRFHSRWDGECALRAFLASDVMTRLLQLLELSAEEPEVLICWGDTDAGLRSLREVRGALELSGCGCVSHGEPS